MVTHKKTSMVVTDENERIRPAEHELDKEELPPAPLPKTEPEPAKKPATPSGFVRCLVHSGSYQDDRLHGPGSEVLVPVDDVARLAHCLAPIK